MQASLRDARLFTTATGSRLVVAVDFTDTVPRLKPLECLFGGTYTGVAALVTGVPSLADGFRWEVHLYESRSQHGNFLDCVKNRARTAAPVEVAHRTITMAHLGNIAMMLGHAIRWDPNKEEILDDEEASRLLSRPKREPWRVQANGERAGGTP